MKREHAEGVGAFFDRVYERLKRGTADYGEESFSARPAALFREIQEELEDVAGWGFILWYRLEVMKIALSAQERLSPPSEPPRATPSRPEPSEPVQRPPSVPPPTLEQRIERLMAALEKIPMAPVMGATIDPDKPVATCDNELSERQAGFSPEHPVARIKANLDRWRPEWKKGVAQNPHVEVPSAPPANPLAELGFQCSKCAGHYTYDALSEHGAAGQDLCMSCAEVKE